jgi:hypothetical protein
MKNIRIGSPFKLIGRLFLRFHMTLFIVLVVAGLGAAVIFVYGIITDTSGDESYVSPINPGSIDQATLDRINSLHTSDQAVTPPALPDGRSNPFGE